MVSSADGKMQMNAVAKARMMDVKAGIHGTSFLDLPRELRDLIYKALCPGEYYDIVGKHTLRRVMHNVHGQIKTDMATLSVGPRCLGQGEISWRPSTNRIIFDATFLPETAWLPVWNQSFSLVLASPAQNIQELEMRFPHFRLHMEVRDEPRCHPFFGEGHVNCHQSIKLTSKIISVDCACGELVSRIENMITTDRLQFKPIVHRDRTELIAVVKRLGRQAFELVQVLQYLQTCQRGAWPTSARVKEHVMECQTCILADTGLFGFSRPFPWNFEL